MYTSKRIYPTSVIRKVPVLPEYPSLSFYTILSSKDANHYLHMATLLMFCNAAKERMRTLTRILAIRLLDVSHVTWYVCDVSHVTCKIHKSYARPQAYHCDSITTIKWVGTWAGVGYLSRMCWLVTGSSTNMKVDYLRYINNACWMVCMLQRLVYSSELLTQP